MAIKDKKKGLLFILLLTITAHTNLIGPVYFAEALPTTFLLDPLTTTSTSINSTFVIKLKVTDVTNLWGWKTALSWDPEVLDFISIEESTFLKQGSATIFISRSPNQTLGTISEIACTRLSTSSVSGSGELASITFKILKEAVNSAITLTNTELRDNTTLHNQIAHTTQGSSVTLNASGNPVSNAGPNQTVDEDTAVTFNGSQSAGTGLTYVWTFTDLVQKTLNGVSPNYTYTKPGSYEVTLTVTDTQQRTSTDRVQVTVRDKTPPVASISVNGLDQDNKGQANTTISYDASESNDPENGEIQYTQWEFGDGGTATGLNVNHVYRANGTYSVRLTVKDTANNVGTSTIIITIGEGGNYTGQPIADAGMDQTINEGGFATLNASSSMGEGLSYKWDFYDGVFIRNYTQESFSYQFNKPGTYTATLKVKNTGGQASDSIIITVKDITKPVPIIRISNEEAMIGEIVTFNAESSYDPENGKISKYQWNFGDGSTELGAKATHQYKEKGSYDVTLVLTDNQGNVAEKVVKIKVGIREKSKNLEIDVYTNKFPYDGKGTNNTSEDFEPFEKITVYASVKHLGNNVANLLVAFYIHSPDNIGINSFFRTAITNKEGIANITYSLPINQTKNVLSKWVITATAQYQGDYNQDYLRFDVQWLTQIQEVAILIDNIQENRLLISQDSKITLSFNNISNFTQKAAYVLNIIDQGNNSILTKNIYIEIPKKSSQKIEYNWTVPLNAELGEAKLSVIIQKPYSKLIKFDNITFIKPLTIITRDLGFINNQPNPLIDNEFSEGKTITLAFTVKNKGDVIEEAKIHILYDNGEIGVVKAILNPKSSTYINYFWDTTDVLEGNYTIAAYIEKAPFEINYEDNYMKIDDVKIVWPSVTVNVVTFYLAVVILTSATIIGILYANIQKKILNNIKTHLND